MSWGLPQDPPSGVLVPWSLSGAQADALRIVPAHILYLCPPKATAGLPRESAFCTPGLSGQPTRF